MLYDLKQWSAVLGALQGFHLKTCHLRNLNNESWWRKSIIKPGSSMVERSEDFTGQERTIAKMSSRNLIMTATKWGVEYRHEFTCFFKEYEWWPAFIWNCTQHYNSSSKYCFWFWVKLNFSPLTTTSGTLRRPLRVHKENWDTSLNTIQFHSYPIEKVLDSIAISLPMSLDHRQDETR